MYQAFGFKPGWVDAASEGCACLGDSSPAVHPSVLKGLW